MTGAMRAVLLAGLLALVFPLTAAAQDPGALFDEGVDLWKRGLTVEAIAKFKEVLAQNPSSEDAYQMLHKAEYQLFLKMLAQGGDAEQIATRLLDLSRPARLEKRMEPERIAELVKEAINGADFGIRRKANFDLQSEHGEYAVPALARYLGSNDIDERTNAVIALTGLGSEAVLPLVELLHSDDVETVRNACAVLARLRDQRSIPALMAQTEIDGVDVLVKTMATDALAAIGFDKGYEPANALDAYLHLARMYFRGEASVIINFDAAWTLWSWKDGALTSRQVLRFMYKYELAEEAAYDALALEPGNIDARIQLVLAAFGEKASVDAMGASASGAELDALKIELASVTALAASQGVAVLEGAALRAMSWGDTGVARAALGAIAECWGGAAITEESALVQGLFSEDKGIRYAAAQGLMTIAPVEEFPGFEMVVPVLADAVAEGSNRQILVIDPDPAVRSQLLHTLNGAGYYAVGAENGASGLVRAKTYSVFDLIILRSSLPDITAFQVVKELADDFRTSSIPIMMLTASADQDRGLFTSAAGFLTDPMQPELYMGDVKTAMSGSLNDERARALDVSLAACNALANARTTLFDLSAAVDALADTLVEKPDNIRLAVLAALAKFGTPAAEERVLAAFNNTANSVAIRVHAAGALGRCLTGAAPMEGTFDALLGGMADSEIAVRIACGGAIGKMDLTAEQRDMVLTARRIE